MDTVSAGSRANSMRRGGPQSYAFLMMTQLPDRSAFCDEFSHQPLAGVRLKVSRALEHLLTLDNEIDQYRNRETYTIVREIDRGDPRLRYSYWLKEVPPAHLSVVIGDVVGNLRAALDHLAWALVLVSGGTPSTGRPATQFPILQSRTTGSGKLRKAEIAGGVDLKVQSLVEELQPYQRVSDPEAHPLAVLNELVNIDKHRTLHVASMKSRDTEVFLVNGSGTRIAGAGPKEPVGHGDVLAVFPLSYEEYVMADPNLSLEVSGLSYIALRDPGPWGTKPVTLLLEDLLNYVSDQVVARFECFFN